MCPAPSHGTGTVFNATIPANDLERARAFNADKLGLTPTREDSAGLIYETPDGAWFRLYRTPYAGTARHTIAGWEVEDLEAEVAELKARGVAFEEYRSKSVFPTFDRLLLLGLLAA